MPPCFKPSRHPTACPRDRAQHPRSCPCIRLAQATPAPGPSHACTRLRLRPLSAQTVPIPRPSRAYTRFRARRGLTQATPTLGPGRTRSRPKPHPYPTQATPTSCPCCARERPLSALARPHPAPAASHAMCLTALRPTAQLLSSAHAPLFAFCCSFPSTSPDPVPLPPTIRATYERPHLSRPTKLEPRRIGTCPLLYLEPFYFLHYFLHLFLPSSGPRLG